MLDELRILGLVDDTHAALTKLEEDYVMRNGLADHRREYCSSAR